MTSLVETVKASENSQAWQWRDYHINYTVQGEGQPLVLVHGFGAAIGHWRQNIPAWVTAGYKVFALDLLGFGDSDKPDVDYSIELWAEMLQEFWQAQIQTPAVWVGNSIGGLISLTVAAQAPEMTQGLILLNCAGGLNHRPEELHWPLNWVMSGFTKLVATPGLGTFIFNQVRQPQRIRNTLKQVYGNRAAITDELVEILYRPSCDPNAQNVFARILAAPPGPRIAELLPQINIPMLVLWGEADPWTPVKGGDIFQAWGEEHPVEFITLPETGHCPHDERPEQVNSLVINWLAQLPTV
ncbi:alpha/beta fold hydrolase [Synechococcus sp. PCC 6312]|uniref:alpha/beta fold hydrolase n=1 Tax=Synechococcus sp. (strain ATCC 27167 / PCC 6312) TaxID=195253 RepID=UPI00029F320A|nr:alpha/beta fold hydrolase [Synechococcus sp. PCC 6312]AFY61618.1 putative hydrolase or acyltransferase of alpha/beta superfamily [Synechococcus sp. PCC 6312]